jgi:hypothetical protein
MHSRLTGSIYLLATTVEPPQLWLMELQSVDPVAKFQQIRLTPNSLIAIEWILNSNLEQSSPTEMIWATPSRLTTPKTTSLVTFSLMTGVLVISKSGSTCPLDPSTPRTLVPLSHHGLSLPKLLNPSRLRSLLKNPNFYLTLRIAISVATTLTSRLVSRPLLWISITKLLLPTPSTSITLWPKLLPTTL